MFVSFITVLVFLFIPCRKYKGKRKNPRCCLSTCAARVCRPSPRQSTSPASTEITTRMRYIDDVTPGGQILRPPQRSCSSSKSPAAPRAGRWSSWPRRLSCTPSSETCCPAPSSIRASPSTSSSNIFSCSMRRGTASRSAWRRRPCSGSSCLGFLERSKKAPSLWISPACSPATRRAGPPRSPFSPRPCSGPSREAPPPTSTDRTFTILPS